jgi:Uma2 family endonuclease
MKRQEYESRVEAGEYNERHVELLEGELVEHHRATPWYASTQRRLAAILSRVIDDMHDLALGVNQPLALTDDSEPQPAICLFPKGRYEEEHPRHAVLAVELFDTSVNLNALPIKERLYRQCSVPQIWVVYRRVVQTHTLTDQCLYHTVFSEARHTIRMPWFPHIEFLVSEILGIS